MLANITQKISVAEKPISSITNSSFSLRDSIQRALSISNNKQNAFSRSVTKEFENFVRERCITASSRRQVAECIFDILQENGSVKIIKEKGSKKEKIIMYLPYILPKGIRSERFPIGQHLKWYNVIQQVGRVINNVRSYARTVNRVLIRWIESEKFECERKDEALTKINRLYLEKMLQDEFKDEACTTSLQLTSYAPPQIIAASFKIPPGGTVDMDSSKMRVEDKESFEVVDTLSSSDNSDIYALVSLAGNRVATGQKNVGKKNNPVYVWNLDTNTRDMVLRGNISRSIRALSLVPSFIDGHEFLASAGDAPDIYVWDITTGLCAQTLSGNGENIYSLTLLPSGKLISGHADGKVLVWEKGDRGFTGNYEVLSGHRDAVRTTAVLPDGRILSAGVDGNICIWSPGGEYIGKLIGHSNTITSLVVLSNQEIISGSQDTTVLRWNLLTSQNVVLQQRNGSVSALKLLPNNLLATGGGDRKIRIFDLSNNKLTQTLTGHTDSVLTLDLSFSGKELISGSQDNTLKTWDLLIWINKKTLEGHPYPVRSLATISDEQLASSGTEPIIRVWNTTSGSCMYSLHGHNDSVLGMAMFDKNSLISVGWNGDIRLWNLKTRELVTVLSNNKSPIAAVIRLDDHSFAVASYDSNVYMWRNSTLGWTSQTLSKHAGSVIALAKLPNGLLVSAGMDKQVIIWDPSTGNYVATMPGNNSFVAAASLPPNYFMAAGYDKLVRVWLWKSISVGPPIYEMRGHSDTIHALLSLPNSKRVITGSFDNTERAWYPELGTYSAVIEAHDDSIWALTGFSDERYASASDGGIIHIMEPTKTPDNQITWLILNLKDGTFFYNKTRQVESFTQRQVNNGEISFKHSGGSVDPSYNLSVKIGDTIFLYPDLITVGIHRDSYTAYVVPSAVGVSAILVLVAGFCCSKKLHNRFLEEQRKREQEQETLISALVNQVFQGTSLVTRNLYIESKKLSLIQGVTEGASGKISKAILNGRLVAIKKLKGMREIMELSEPLRSKYIRQLLQEIRAETQYLLALNHPNVIRALGVTTVEVNSLALITEFLPRGSLGGLMQTACPLAWQCRLSIARDIARGLLYLHKVGQLVHCDLKSSNIFIGEGYEAKIGDFGSARPTKGKQSERFTGGTLQWMAPELLSAYVNGGEFIFSEQSDIYALGVLFWELVTWSVPYLTNNNLAKLRLTPGTSGVFNAKEIYDYMVRNDVINHPERHPLGIPGNVPEDFKHLILGCLRFDSKARLSIDEILARLDSMQGEIYLSAETTTTTPYPDPVRPTSSAAGLANHGIFARCLKQERHARPLTNLVPYSVSSSSVTMHLSTASLGAREETPLLGQYLGVLSSNRAVGIASPPSLN